MAELKGLIFDIQGFSVHDGPGCRTLIFMKGCPLRCDWCANPEGISPKPQLMYYRSRCKAESFSCVNTCEENALFRAPDNCSVYIDRGKCNDCNTFECVDGCNYDALRVCGQYINVDKLMRRIRRDRRYWGSGGGVTLTGGEPMLQPEFITELLKQCHERYIHTAIETCGYAPWEDFERVLPYVEWVFFDLKHMDSDKHKESTGKSNTLILENARQIASAGEYKLVFRVPLIPGFNDSEENIKATAEFIAETGRDEVNILPIHYLGISKYSALGLDCRYALREMIPREKLMDIKRIFNEYSIKCYVGSSTPF